MVDPVVVTIRRKPDKISSDTPKGSSAVSTTVSHAWCSANHGDSGRCA